MTEVQHLIREQRAHRRLQFQASSADSVEYGATISSVLRAFLREDDHIVQLREKDATNQSLQYSGHQLLIGRRRITDTERYLLHLEETHVREESSLLDIRRLDGDLMSDDTPS